MISIFCPNAHFTNLIIPLYNSKIPVEKFFVWAWILVTIYLLVVVYDGWKKIPILCRNKKVFYTHHAEGRVDLDDVAKKKTVTGFRCPRACRIRKYQFENRSWELRLPTLFKNWFLLHKLLLKLEKVTKNSNFWIFFQKSHFWM
jgi:hypothetical protein